MEHRAAVGHHRLGFGEGIHIQTAPLEHTPDMAEHIAVEHQPASENAAEGGFGNIVFRRAESAGSEHNVGLLHSLTDGRAYRLGIVVHGSHIFHCPPGRGYHAGYIPRIRVDHLPYQQLVAYHDYRNFHKNKIEI